MKIRYVREARVALLAALALVALAGVAQAQSKIVISQVYGGGGNSGATYKNDFVELYNAGNTAQNLSGWSVQYASASGTSWQVTTLAGQIQPGHYYLVKEAQGAGGSTELPAPDATGTIPMSSSQGKVAVANSTTAFSGACPSAPVDFVAFGAANCSQGSATGATAAPGLSNTTADFRKGGGCAESGVNSADFDSPVAPAPRNSASAVNGCLSIANVSLPEGNSGTTAFNFPVSLNVALSSPVSFLASTADGTATAGSDYAALSSSFTIPAGATSATITVQVSGDTVVEPDETFFVNLTSITGASPAGPSTSTLQATGTIQNDDTAGVSLSISPATLPGSSEDTLYSQTLSVANGTACIFSASGSVPSGLALDPNGTLRGVPSFSGNYNFTVSASCANGSAMQAYAVGILFACENGIKTSTPVHVIQGSGATSPLTGKAVEVEGIVVGSFRGSGQLGGFYLQEPDATWDSDPATSEGVFIYDGGNGASVNIGDRVRLQGTVSEYASSGVTLTEIGALQNKLVCSAGNPFQVTTITLPVAAVGDLERYEGMAVKLTQQLVVTGNYSLAKYNEVDLAPKLLFQPTQLGDPASWADAADLNKRSLLTLSNGRTDSNVYPTIYPQGGLSASNTLRVGAWVNYDAVSESNTPLTGVLDQRFGAYLLQPTGTLATFYNANPRPDAATFRATVGGRFRLASANVLNYFTTLGSRGAQTADEFVHQRTKILAELSKLNADVYGLSEVQNFNDGKTGAASGSHAYTNDALQSLVDGLNALTAPGTYAYVDTLGLGDSNGTDAIRNAIIYKTAVLSPVGPPALFRNLNYDTNRPTLAQTFKPATGAKADRQSFTVVVNHFRSRSSACGVDNDDAVQGNCNLTRLQMAKAVVNWLSQNPTGDTAVNRQTILVGDFNAYFGEDPIQWFKTNGYTNLIDKRIGAEHAYSYNFSAQLGYIDHAIASAAMAPLVTGIAEWHINADEPAVLEALNSSTKNQAALPVFYAPDEFAASDHDPFLVGFNPLAGDLNDDGVVDANDQKLILAAVGKLASAVDGRLDYDGDGKITLNDYRIWASLYRAYLQ